MKYLFLIIFATLLACNKKKMFAGPNSYMDDFEKFTSIDSLLVQGNLYWSYTQLTSDLNSIEIDTNFSNSGQHALKFIAEPSIGNLVSKASIAKQKMAFWENETVCLKASYFLQGNESKEWLFLMDIEEQATIGAGPGMRIALVENKLRVEYKFNEKDILQTSEEGVEFPRNQWVDLVWEIKLSKKKKGTVKLWQNGELIINSSGNKTLPTDLLYFQQGTKGMYSSCEIGITANSKDSKTIMWVDNFSVEKIN